MSNFFARLFGRSRATDLGQFRELFERFQQILKGNTEVLEVISELEDKLGGEYIFDINYLKDAVDRLSDASYLVVSNLNVIADNRYHDLFSRQSTIREELNIILTGSAVPTGTRYALAYDEIYSDMTELVGGKNANLGEIRNNLQMVVPDGFVITTDAYRRFMSYGNLWPQLRQLQEASATGETTPAAQFDAEVDRLFSEAKMPSDLTRDIAQHLSSLRRRLGPTARLAVRSSAFGEDSPTRSFAGQFQSILNCTDEDIVSAYVKVVASRWKRRVLDYLGGTTLDDHDIPMAVGVQEMIPARTSGVVYSVEPSGRYPGTLALAAGYGLGTGIVGGTAPFDFYKVSRLDPSRIVSRRVARKDSRPAAGDDGSVRPLPIDEKQQSEPCLSDEGIVELAGKTLMLDRYFKRPVDIEWCFNESGQLYILQCRPLNISSQRKWPRRQIREAAAGPVIMKQQGQVAQRGIAAGRVHVVTEDDDGQAFPIGGIAVTRYTTPRLSAIIRRAAAIVTDVGSPTGHMATIAREFGVPMIVNTGDATRLLREGTQITVDAEENVVYEGIVRELVEYEVEAEDVYTDLREYRILRQILRKISPLHLIDPGSAEFAPRNCRTYHDIVRFSHEKAVQFLIDLNVSSRKFRGIESRKLVLPIPLGLHVIDLGGGVDAEAYGPEIDSAERLRSVPMQAVLSGLLAPGAWSTQPVQIDFSDLVSSLTRFSMTDRVGTYQGQNLAVISEHYANISLRLGYHFNVIDAYVSESVDDNYIYFRFVGGVTETERRHLRARLIKAILEKLNFRVTVSGDLVVARLKKLEREAIIRVLRETGRLIGFTRQLDTQMQNEDSIATGLRTFFNGVDEAE